MTDEQIIARILEIQASEISYSGKPIFTLPKGTEFYNTWRLNYATAQDLRVLDSSFVCRLRSINKDGIQAYGRCESHKKGEKPDPTRRWYNYSSYLSIKWTDLLKDKTCRKLVLDWINKVTPDYSVDKQGGVITFTNNKTQEKLYCDLGKQTFTRTYKKGKDRQVRYPAQFFKYVYGRLLIDKIVDPKAETFKKLVDMVSDYYSRCSNFGTFLVRMFDHQHLEEYISAGVEFDFNIVFKYSDFAKNIRRKLDEHKIRYDMNVGSLFCSDLNIGRAVFSQIENVKNFQNMVNILSYNIQPLNTLVNHYHYDLKTLFAYCRKKNWQSGITPRWGVYKPLENPEISDKPVYTGSYDCITSLRDYARLAIEVYGADYEKYPENLAEAHTEVNRLYNLRKREIDAKKYAEMIDKTLEWKNKEFVVIYPETPEQIIEEGKRLRHCVGSYISSVVKGECKILFLRRKDEKETPFVTIEIQGGNIRQARGVGNSNPIYDARMALIDFAKDKKLLYR